MRRMRVLATVLFTLLVAAAMGSYAWAAEGAAQAPGSEAAATTERVESLEKQTVVLREDLGRARLEVRTEMEAAERRHQEAVSHLQEKINQLNAQMEEDRKRQERRNRNLWYAIGALAIGLLVMD